MATCYEKIEKFTVDEADPKDILEILKNCSIFTEKFYWAAHHLIQARYLYYGHIAQLFIKSETLDALSTAIVQIQRYISNPAKYVITGTKQDE